MKAGTPGFVGNRLTEAREARGLTAASLAELVGVSPQAIANYEGDVNSPRPDVMAAISTRLNFPISYFLRPANGCEKAPIFWRSNASAVKIGRLKAEKRLIWMREAVEYLGRYFDFPAVDLPDVKVPDDFRALNSSFIEAVALSCRKYFGLGLAPIPDVVEELEAHGVFVSRISIEFEGLDAFSYWSVDEGRPYVVLGADKASAVRSRFDAAHELAHLILHRGVDQKRVNSPADWKLLETQAHRFASAFLLPEEAFVHELWAPSLDGFLSIKQRWGVSIAAMIKRSSDLGMLSDEQARRMWINYNRRGWRLSEPLDDSNSIPTEIPQLLRRSFNMLISEKVVRREQIASILHLPPNDLEEILALPNGFLSGHDAEIRALPKFRQNHGGPVHGGGSVVAFSGRGKR
ncbi:helix-turn-helix domain-containing protein [Azospirillum sp. B2RO_4]|uniref:helix-turn-helix domain-containing protein n=1 Tax=Azospirillum sp. B2RO_4 TaxID=3027796 RepID=UPI003DA81C2E